jgi:hypothetical protein
MLGYISVTDDTNFYHEAKLSKKKEILLIN